MTAFASRWLDWQPSNSAEDGAHAGNDGVRSPAPSTYETPNQRTDKTDKKASVSFVSASSKRFQPETGGDAGGTAEHDGTQSRADAEALALTVCISKWMNEHAPPPTEPEDGCAHCREPMPESGAMPFLTRGGHCWLHSRCYAPWTARLRTKATDALAAMKIGGVTTQHDDMSKNSREVRG